MGQKLLLADDSVTIQRVIELTFADEDVQVIAVGDGRQAIACIEAEKPDIVLADIGMPERDGYEVAAFVKGRADLAHVPVLLLTGAFEPIDEARARAAGCDGVLVKPFEPQMVINRVKDLLAGRRPAGLWAAASLSQATQATKPAPPADFDLVRVAPPTTDQHAGGTVEDYFDRLDAAFAELDSPAAAASTGASAPAAAPVRSPASMRPAESGDALAGWDPDLTGDPTRPGSSEPAFDVEPPGADASIPPAPLGRAAASASTPQPQAPRQARPSPQGAAAPVTSSPPGPAEPQGASLADAFAALLAAEHGRPIAPPLVRPEHIPDDTIEDIVRRVIDRMGTSAVQQTVLDVAERMVREEIARIKRGS